MFNFTSLKVSELKEKLTPTTIIVGIIIILFLIVIITEIISDISKKVVEKQIEEASPNKTFYSSDNSVSLEIPKKYGLSQYHSDNNYLLELRSQNNLDIFISHKEIIEGKDLSEIVSADKTAFLEEFEATSNISDKQDIQTNNDSPAYTYSFQYLDQNTNKTYYLQIIWIETENGYNVIDVEFPLEYINLYNNIITDVVAGLNLNYQNNRKHF